MEGSVVSLLSSVVGAEEGGHGCHCSGCSGWLLSIVSVGCCHQNESDSKYI